MNHRIIALAAAILHHRSAPRTVTQADSPDVFDVLWPGGHQGQVNLGLLEHKMAVNKAGKIIRFRDRVNTANAAYARKQAYRPR